jgi:hypothetical protein
VIARILNSIALSAGIFLCVHALTSVAEDEIPQFVAPEYPSEFVAPCKGKGVGATCTIFFENEWQERRCVEGRADVLICVGGEPKALDSKLYEACEGKVEKDTCVSPIKDRRTGKYHSIDGHCNRDRTNSLLCLPGEWPWRD